MKPCQRSVNRIEGVTRRTMIGLKSVTQQRAKVASLSRRCNPTSRKVNFIYHAEGYDIPGGWEALMANYYDVMVRQDYEWYTLCMAFKYSKKLETEFNKYVCHGEDDLGLDVERKGDRLNGLNRLVHGHHLQKRMCRPIFLYEMDSISFCRPTQHAVSYILDIHYGGFRTVSFQKFPNQDAKVCLRS